MTWKQLLNVYCRSGSGDDLKITSPLVTIITVIASNFSPLLALIHSSFQLNFQTADLITPWLLVAQPFSTTNKGLNNILPTYHFSFISCLLFYAYIPAMQSYSPVFQFVGHICAFSLPRMYFLPLNCLGMAKSSFEMYFKFEIWCVAFPIFPGWDGFFLCFLNTLCIIKYSSCCAVNICLCALLPTVDSLKTVTESTFLLLEMNMVPGTQ